MKSIKTLLATIIICLVAFNSCKKDNKDLQPPTAISFKLDGANKYTTTVVSAYDKGSKGLLVAGSLSTSETITISLLNIKTGTFDVVNDGIDASYSNGDGLTDTYTVRSGTVTITSLSSNLVSGTFSFVATNQANASKNITEGKFTTKYVSQ